MERVANTRLAADDRRENMFLANRLILLNIAGYSPKCGRIRAAVECNTTDLCLKLTRMTGVASTAKPSPLEYGFIYAQLY